MIITDQPAASIKQSDRLLKAASSTAALNSVMTNAP